jgi:hypothetical protein
MRFADHEKSACALVARARATPGQACGQLAPSRAAAACVQRSGSRGVHLQPQMKRVIWKPFGKTLGPLNRRGGPIVGFRETQLGQLGLAANAIEIDMDQADASRVLIDQREGWASHVSRGWNAKSPGQALHERGLAGAESPRQSDDVADTQLPPEPSRNLLRFVAATEPQGDARLRGSNLHTVMFQREVKTRSFVAGAAPASAIPILSLYAVLGVSATTNPPRDGA